ncbi:MAG: NAD(P)-dependent oxidoreductase [Chloroflexi bacterium]|nr:NAD(P)-dependent oxidoreductase [Chloroflexota bacterium]
MSEETRSVGFVGLGLMGRPMAQSLLKAGYALNVYNRDARKTEPLVSAGARRGERPGDVVEAGGIVITMVANDAALENVTLGPDGILDRLGPGGVHVSMATLSPALSSRMAELHAQRQCAYVAAPVFGRPDAAAAQKLWICAAGPEAARERVRPLLQSMGQGIFDFGEDPAHASVIKICGNFMIGSAIEAMGEAMALAEKCGIERSDFINMFTQTMFACGIYQNYGRIIAERRFTPVGFEMQLALKDNNLIREAAEQAHVTMPLASLNHDRLMANMARGRSKIDWTALTELINEDAGL